MKYLSIIFAALLLVSCGGYTPQYQELNKSSNENYDVALLFEYDGCKVYAFTTGGGVVYYTNCQGSTSWTTNRRSGNYNRTEHHNVSTSVIDSSSNQ